MSETILIGQAPLTLEVVESVARRLAACEIAGAARTRIARGREALEQLLARGERIYGVNTGVGGNIKFTLEAEQADLLQLNIMRHLSCATGAPLPTDTVRAAMLLRLATFATGFSGVRVELADALAALLLKGVTPVVPRYGSVGASGDLMPSAYIARVLLGVGEADFAGARIASTEALSRAGLDAIRFAPKEGLALINGTTMMTGIAALVWLDAGRVLRAMLAAIALAMEALAAPTEPYEDWVHQAKGHPGQIGVAAYMRRLLDGSKTKTDPAAQSCYSLRCVPQGLGPMWEALETGRAVIEREVNSANDNPLVDPESGRVFRAGNFYGGHIARLLDGLKIDLAIAGNWGNSLMAVLVDDRFNKGLPPNLTPEPGVNSGLKGMQLSVTSLTCAIRQMAGPSSIHSLPTEQYNQDVVSLGMHSAVTALDALECLENEAAMLLIASAQAVDLRGCGEGLGRGARAIYEKVREVVAFMDRDRPMEDEVRGLAGKVRGGEIDLG
ncbi:MAG TPA: aromatic amino acid ammonia-lyase [Bryobacteraceae bacterium]|jgi:phenylalanine ammonia-lyase